MPIPSMKHRAPGNYDPNQASKAASLGGFEPTRTQQHQAAETDINLIVKRFTKTGVLPYARLQPLYGDFEAMSFQEAQLKVRAAQEAFQAIPANIRARFENDPVKFVEFASKEENYDELVRLKLAEPRKAPEKDPQPTPPPPPQG